jgi:hypothetical protein
LPGKVCVYSLPLAGYANLYFGCNARITGLLEVWRGMDAYLVNVDQLLCSPECPCYITNTQAFTTNAQVAPYFNQWTLSTEPYGATSFQKCDTTVRNSAYANALVMDSDFDPNRDFDANAFADYMARLENRFQCSGWCRSSYTNRVTGQEMFISKYLFTDINR